ncbi:MAG: plasmid mobilization relaxosome protein MobC [Defluviitaleaceae bacterium]|nr:plasmid mobilization relaxosome protein MobC [Defluviitaleaceae bacterium]
MKEDKPIARNNCIKIYLSDEELASLSERMGQAGAKNRSNFIRTMVNQGCILNVDLSGLNKLMFLMSNATNNLNQIARAANSGQAVRAADVDALRRDYNALAHEVGEILRLVTAPARHSLKY